MIASLEKRPFFTPVEEPILSSLGLPDSQQEHDIRLAIGALMLAPALDVGLIDGATTGSEFEAIERYVERLDREFELGTQEELSAIGTEMGMLPMIKGTWDKSKFEAARQLLADILNRIDSGDAHLVRNAVAKACLDVAQAGAGWFHVHNVDSNEKQSIREIVTMLQLDTCSEGLHLIEKAGLLQ